MTKISSLTALAGADVVPATDLIPVVDMSEAGTARNKKMTFAELILALGEDIEDRVAGLMTAGTNVTLTYDDGAGTLTIDVAAPGSGDITDFNEAVDDRVAALLQEGTNVTLTYNDGAGTLTIDAAGGGGSVSFATAAEIRTGTEAAKAVAPDQLVASATPQTLTDGATINWDMASGYNAKVTLGGARTIAAPTNPKVGLTYVLEVIQDGGGGRTATWNSCFKWGAAGTPTLSTAAGKRDLVTLYCYDASTPEFRAIFSRDS